MSKEKAKICIESALSEFGLYESLGIRDYLKSAYDNMLKSLKEFDEWYENLEAISICITYDSYMYYRIRNWKFFVAFNHTSNMGNNRKYYITGESN